MYAGSFRRRTFVLCPFLDPVMKVQNKMSSSYRACFVASFVFNCGVCSVSDEKGNLSLTISVVNKSL